MKSYSEVNVDGTPSRWRKPLWRIVRLAIVGYSTIILAMLFLENKIVFPATKYPIGDWGAAERHAFTDVWFHSSDGTRLHGWLAEHQAPRGVLLFCHGNAGNVTHRGGTIAYLRDRFELTVLVFDYRGYGRSDGKPNEMGILSDARAARDWLCDHGDLESKEILLLGRSLGGAVAVDLAADFGAKALILENTFTSLPDAGAAAFPWLPVRWLMKNQFNARAKIGAYHGPLLISHAAMDEIVPFELGRRLYDAAVCEKRFFEIVDGRHNDVLPESYYDEFGLFLSQVLAEPSPILAE